MKPVVSLAACVMVLAIAGTSTLAQAATQGQTKVKVPTAQSETLNFSPMTSPTNGSYISDSSTNFNTKTQSRVYQFNLKGKWGVKFDVNQPETAPSGLNDVDAGAYYKLTPSVRVGGTVGFGEKSDPLKPEPKAKDKTQPRVRLETTFKF